MSFFLNRNNAPSTTELLMTEYKKSVKKKIVGAIKDLQIEYSDGNHSIIVSNNELSNQLVCGLEAMFIHGMKGSFIGKLSSAVFGAGVASGGSDGTQFSAAATSSRLPEPNFWMYVLVFSHRDTIQRIEKLPQVTSDIGRGRSWIRLALNDGLLGAYLQAMQKDRITSQKFFHRYAFIRDPELLDVITKYIVGIEQYKFDLALNSSMLNRWQTAPLVLAGLWTPNVIPSQAVPEVQVAVDAALTLDEEGIDPLEASASTPSAPSGMQFLSGGLLNEDEALKLILRGQSFGSGSSSATGSPVGTPRSSGLAVRVMNKNGSRKPVRRPAPNLSREMMRSRESSPRPEPKPEDEVKSDFEVSAAVAPSTFESMNHYDSLAIRQTAEDQTIGLNSTSMPSDPIQIVSNKEQVDSDPEDSIYSSSYKFHQPDYDTDNTGLWATADSSPANLTPSKEKEDEKEKQTEEIDMVDQVETKEETIINNNNNNNNNTIEVELSKSEPMFNEAPKSCGSTTSSKGSHSSMSLNLAIPSLAGFIDSWYPFLSGRFFDTPPDAPDNSKFGFTLKPEVRVGALNEANSQRLMQLFDQVVREEGLDSQNYECADCSKAIGTLFGPAKLCAYSKQYFCDECHIDEMALIPSKIVYNWNFQLLKVSRKSKIFLDCINIEPIIDVKSFNVSLFGFAPDLKEVSTLRTQLKFMNAYLTTCNASGGKTKEAYMRLLWPRSYLHEDVDMYSIKDLEEVRSGKLKSILGHAARLCREHILSCILCQGKGFICEVCRDSKPIYPFDLDHIAQCPKCFTVFHLECSVNLNNCPKCDRIEARNLNWHISEARLTREPRSAVELTSLD